MVGIEEMIRTKLEELKRKQCSLKYLNEHSVGTGIYNYETNIKLPLDSPNHNSFPIEPEWFRQAMKEMWSQVLSRIRTIAEKDVASLKHDAIIEAGKFLKEVEKI